ncbi:hypothetical protein NDU88_000658 [Pleurodeles waltl]|uniref:Uncharacterized protein n=1 Tax=Pleurodeles waltl TaxID=8319 RepID=A0AAV7NAA6_PLEWA|nr:hypothetical protein NDU88_000658 [Pleurodeles waltl]
METALAPCRFRRSTTDLGFACSLRSWRGSGAPYELLRRLWGCAEKGRVTSCLCRCVLPSAGGGSAVPHFVQLRTGADAARCCPV